MKIRQSHLMLIVNKIKEKFSNLFGEDLISLVLFGSQAKSEANCDSDIDILVVLKEKQQREEIIDFIVDLSLEFGLLVSFVYLGQTQFESETSPLLINIRWEGICL